MARKEHWAYGGIVISDLKDEKFIGRKLKPIENDYAFAMPHKVFKIRRLQEESYEIIKCEKYGISKDSNTVALVLRGKTDMYTMLCEIDENIGMILI